ncbi:MAG: phosphoribosylaminoimidazolesuccinocarboxamide synthase [Myxococcales bacterium]|nr:phosphoribosylaminoimidazolesuccinocarboxamide synthase [Myxococcales bacterium]MCB9732342.1 phosphoribosylaminoimidazolesuccinocarboxamide synthase [Deltaproteobacteria bacterium]
MLALTDIQRAIPGALDAVDDVGGGYEPLFRGKVRDAFRAPSGHRVLVTTDRVSAFDQVLGTIPFKGQVLNELTAWWLRKTTDIVANHLVSVPDPNVMVCLEAKPLPVEVIVRGYITGVTSTSLWTLYSRGVERPYGLDLPPNLEKNDPLPVAVITPTTKAEAGQHDERLTSEEVVSSGLVDAALWEQVTTAALALFARGQKEARKRGLILVDTKYEFGLVDGRLVLIDEVHTPDSSRYWVADSYARSRDTGAAPEHFDKELLRQWLSEQGYRGDGPFPGIPDAVKVRLANHYIAVYERLTGQTFVPGRQPVLPRIQAALGGLSAASEVRGHASIQP